MTILVKTSLNVESSGKNIKSKTRIKKRLINVSLETDTLERLKDDPCLCLSILRNKTSLLNYEIHSTKISPSSDLARLRKKSSIFFLSKGTSILGKSVSFMSLTFKKAAARFLGSKGQSNLA